MTEPARRQAAKAPLPREPVKQVFIRPFWVEYPAATALLAQLQALHDQQPGNDRPSGLLVHGPTNNGKTSTALRFARQVNALAQKTEGPRRIPVIHAQMPPGPDLGALYGNILRAVNAPTLPTWRWERKQEQVLQLAGTLGLRMLIIDEVHNLLQGKIDQRSLVLNGLKFLSNELRIPVVAMGTNEARIAFQTDQQLGNRFEPLEMPRWRPGKDYAWFLKQLCGGLALDDGQDLLASRAVVERIHHLTDGLTGETFRLIAKLAVFAAQQDEQTLQVEWLGEVGWVHPNDRRS